MKRLCKFFKIFLIFCLTLCSCQNTIEGNLIITNVNIIDVKTGTINSKRDIIVNGNTITSIIEHNNRNYKAETIIDGSKKYLIPGLIDTHAHPFLPLQSSLAQFTHFGVTSILVPGGSSFNSDTFSDLRKRSMDNINASPRVKHTSPIFTMRGAHPVKTYTNNKWIDGETIIYIKDSLQIKSVIKELSKTEIIGIKVIIEDGPAPPYVDRIPQHYLNLIVEESRAYGLPVFAHVSDIEEVYMAEKADVQNIMHFVGVDIDWKDDIDLINKIIKKDISWATTLMIDKSFLYPLHPEWLNVTDIVKVYGKDSLNSLITPEQIKFSKEFLNILKIDYNIENPNLENLIIPQVEDLMILYEKGCNITIGTDNGNDFILSGYSVHEEMQLMELGGFKPKDILKMATHNGAKMLNEIDKLGTIEEGKFADLILLNKNPLESIKHTLTIDKVIKNGVVQKRIDNK